MRTKILSFIILGFIIPQVSFGAVIAGWNATSTTQGWVSPTRINGVDQTIAGKNFISTSTNENVLTNLKIVNSTTTNATSTSLGVTYINTLSSAGLNIHSNNGTDVALFGAGGGTNTTLYGGTNIHGLLSVTSIGTSTFAGDIDVTGNVKLGGNLFAPINLQLSGFTQGSALFVGPSGTIAQNNSKLFWDNTNFRLGIGTTSPMSMLTVAPSGATGNMTFYGGGSYTGNGIESIVERGDTTAYNLMSLRNTLGTARFIVQGNGNVGIGTTTPLHMLSVTNPSGAGTNAYVAQFASAAGVNVPLVMYSDPSGSAIVNQTGSLTGAEYIYMTKSGNMTFNTAGSEWMRINSTGNVGIGSASPNGALDIFSHTGTGLRIATFTDNSSDDPQLQVYPGKASRPSYSFLGGNTTGMFLAGGPSLAFSTNGTEKVRVDQNGNVGIGTTSPAQLLSVGSVGAGTGILLKDTVAIGSMGSVRDQGFFAVGAYYNGSNYVATDDDELVMNASTAGWQFSYNNTTPGGTFTPSPKMTLTTAGNLGVGTTSPGQRLSVAGNLYTTGGIGAGVSNPNAGTVQTTAGIINLNGSALQFNNSVNDAAATIANIGTTGTSKLTFRTASADRMVIDTNGNVGIGTSNPTQLLSVNGNVEIKGNSGNRYIITDETNTGTTKLTMQAGAGSSGFGGAINLYGHANATNPGWVTVGISASAGTVGTASEGRFTVNTQALGGGTDIFTVLRSGNVGIGTTSPVDKLHVVLNSNSSLVSRSEDSVRIGRIAAGRPALILDTSDTTYTNRSWYMENRGSVGSLVTGRNGLDVLTLGNSGSVGIGTVSPNSNTKLNVIGGISSEKTAGGYYQEMNYSGNNPYLGFYALTGYTIGYSTNIGTAPTSGITILNGGNVGIGTTNPSEAKLEIAGTSGELLKVGTLTNDWGANTAIGVEAGNGLLISKINAANDANRTALIFRHATEGGQLQLFNNGGTSANKGAHISAGGLSYFNGGNVGVGTTTPNVALSVNGDIQIEKGAPAYTNYLVCYMNGGKLGHMTQSALLAGAGSATCVAN